jgi:RimJ/RimL family protein N-acetyltransferase
MSDLDALVRHADDPEVSRCLRDRFPFPYTRADGEAYLASCAEPHDDWRFAVEVDGAAVGGMGFHPGEDVHRHGAEVGYWLGRALWGRGIALAALRAAVPAAMAHFSLHRVFAGVYSSNPTSMRVLEKAGFQREAVLRCAAVKRGGLLDVSVYAIVRRSLAEPPAMGPDAMRGGTIRA